MVCYDPDRSMADDAKPGDDDRRGDSRAPIELKVEYKRLNSFFADYTKNISRGGTFIKTNRPLPIGTEFVFKLFVPQLERPLAIHGEVQWVVTEQEADAQRTEPGMGIRFVYKSGDPQAEIARSVERLMVDSLGQRLTTKLMEHSREND
jgi:type IV pilus assembly protein PilZ